MDMAKIALLGIIGVLIGLQFKSGKQEYSAYIGIAVALIIFIMYVSISHRLRIPYWHWEVFWKEAERISVFCLKSLGLLISASFVRDSAEMRDTRLLRPRWSCSVR